MNATEAVRSGLRDHLARLWRYGLVLSGRRDVAEDLVQATCLRALEREAQFKPDTHLDRWLFSILHSIWLNEVRSRQIRQGAGFVDPELSLFLDGTHQMETGLMAAQVIREVQRLPEAQRGAVFLVYVEGLSYREAADLLGVPIGTIMSRLAAARDTLGRLDHLMQGGRPFRKAFAALLQEAPVARLELTLAAGLVQPVRAERPRLGYWGLVGVAAAALLILGAGLDRLAMSRDAALLSSAMETERADDWRHAVAQYLSLYTRDTLSNLPDIAETSRADLAHLGQRLGLDLTPARVELPDFMLKRADLYAYDGRALAFLAYLDPQSGPVALCILDEPGTGNAQKVERQGGANVVTWSSGQRSFMLIGQADTRKLEALAATVASRFNADAGGRG